MRCDWCGAKNLPSKTTLVRLVDKRLVFCRECNLSGKGYKFTMWLVSLQRRFDWWVYDRRRVLVPLLVAGFVAMIARTIQLMLVVAP